MSYTNYNKVHQLIKLHREEQALIMLKDFIAQDPNFGGYYHILAYLLSSKGDHHAALQAVDTAIQIEPEKASYLSQKADFLLHIDLKKSLETIDQAIAMDPSDYRSHVTRAHALYAQKKYDMAYTAVIKAQSLEPNRGQIFNLKYHIEMALGHIEKARNTLLESLDIDASNSDTLSLLGRHDLDRNKIQETSHLFKSALQSDPNSVKAQIGLKESVYRSNSLYNSVNNYRLKLVSLRSLTSIISIILLVILAVSYNSGYLENWLSYLDSPFFIFSAIVLLHTRWISPVLLLISNRNAQTRHYNSQMDKKLARPIKILFKVSRYSFIAGILCLGLQVTFLTYYLAPLLFKICFSVMAIILMLDHYRSDDLVDWEWSMVVIFWSIFIVTDIYIYITGSYFMNIGFILNLIFVAAYYTLKQVAIKQVNT